MQQIYKSTQPRVVYSVSSNTVVHGNLQTDNYQNQLKTSKQPMGVTLSWQHMIYKLSKLGRTDLVFDL